MIILKSILALFLAAALGLPTTQTRAQGPPADLIDAARFDQKLDAQIPLDLAFRDEEGRGVVLGSYFGSRPVILVLAYYECPMLCTLVLNGLTRSIQELYFQLGQQYEIVTVSIDPRETPGLAAEKKAAYLAEYGRPGGESGWHFLTGRQPEIDRLADAIGFRFRYDQDHDQYAHPAGVVLATPQGRVSHYFFGIEFNPADLRLGLVESSQNQIGSLVDQLYLLCYEYDPETGTYALMVQNVLQIAGVGTVLILGGAILMMVRRERAGGYNQDEVPR
jgi:protein SCO1